MYWSGNYVFPVDEKANHATIEQGNYQVPRYYKKKTVKWYQGKPDVKNMLSIYLEYDAEIGVEIKLDPGSSQEEYLMIRVWQSNRIRKVSLFIQDISGWN